MLQIFARFGYTLQYPLKRRCFSLPAVTSILPVLCMSDWNTLTLCMILCFCIYIIWIWRVGGWLDGWVEGEIRRKGGYQHYLYFFNPLNAQLNPIRHFLALLWAHPILHVSRIRVNYFSFFTNLPHSSTCSTFLLQEDGCFLTLQCCLCV
jgi:hypothetical protein